MAVIPVLTNEAVQAARPHEKPYRLFDGKGLYLLIPPTGRKGWRFKYRFAGKEKLISFGVYPAVSLEEARLRRQEARRLLEEGTNPSEHHQMIRAAKLAEQVRQSAETRFSLDSDGALSFRLGNRRLTLTPAETAELRNFLDATRAVGAKVTPCP